MLSFPGLSRSREFRIFFIGYVINRNTTRLQDIIASDMFCMTKAIAFQKSGVIAKHWLILKNRKLALLESRLPHTVVYTVSNISQFRTIASLTRLADTETDTLHKIYHQS